METKIFESRTLRQAIKDCLAEGFMPASTKIIWQLKKEGKIPIQWYDSGTLFVDGEFRDITLEELKNIEEVYEKGGCLVWLGSVGSYSDAGGDYSLLNDLGVLVGVKN